MFEKQMRVRTGYLRNIFLAMIAVVLLLFAFINVKPAEALNGQGNKAANFLGYEYVDSHNIRIFTDKGDSNPPRDAVKIFQGSGVNGTRLTVDASVLNPNEVDMVTGGPAGDSAKANATTIRVVESFQPGQLYTVLISGTVKGRNNLPLGFFYFNKDIMFTFEVPDAAGNYSKPVTLVSRPENGASMVPWEGNIGFTVSQAVYNHEEVASGIVLKKNGVILAHGMDTYAPIDGYPHTFFYLPMTGSGGSTSYNLSPNSEYTLIIPAIKGSNGNVLLEGKEISFHTTSADLVEKFATAPLITANAGVLNVSWATISGATGYNIYASENPYFNFAKLNPAPVTEMTYQTTITGVGLDPAKSYFIRVTAVNGGGEAGFSPFASTDPNAPEWAASSAVMLSNISKNSLTLSWPAATDNSGVVSSYQIYLNGILLDSVAGNITTYNAIGLAVNTAYVFKIEAGDATGNWTANGPSVTALTALPLVWDAATDNIAVSSYRLYQEGSVIATTVYNQTTWEVTGLVAGTTYKFQVQAGDAAGNWSNNGPSLEVAAGAEPDLTVPSWTNGTLMESNVTQTGLTLNWSAASDDVGVVSYKVYQGITFLGSVSSSVYSYDVMNLLPGTSYTFQVQAGDAVGNWSSNGPSRTVSTTAATPNTVATPAASPASGALVGGTLVTLVSSTQEASIYYTLDGSTPTVNGTAYSGPIAINSPVTVKAIAVKAGMSNSDVLTAAYTIQAEPGSGVIGVYIVTPADNPAYTKTKTADGIDTLTINSGFSGSQNFAVTVSPITVHTGSEKAVFVQLRNGVQFNLNTAAADFDNVNTASTSLEVQPGDIVKVFIVDDLFNSTDNIATVLEQ